MNGVRVVVHQSSSLSDSRKLVSITRSASVAVVSEIAPRWMTASSLRLSSQPNSSLGGTTSATCRLPRLRHLPSAPSSSLTAVSARPASLRLATTVDPMKPAPPVTNNMPAPQPPPEEPLPLPQTAPPCNVAPVGTPFPGAMLDRPQPGCHRLLIAAARTIL